MLPGYFKSDSFFDRNMTTNETFIDIYNKNEHHGGKCSIVFKGKSRCDRYYIFEPNCQCANPKRVQTLYHKSRYCQPYIKQEFVNGRLFIYLCMRCYCYEKHSS